MCKVAMSVMQSKKDYIPNLLIKEYGALSGMAIRLSAERATCGVSSSYRLLPLAVCVTLSLILKCYYLLYRKLCEFLIHWYPD